LRRLLISGSSTVVDLGTGGVSLAYPWPLLSEVQFCLIDSIGKKSKCERRAEALGLKNVTTRHTRIETSRTAF